MLQRLTGRLTSSLLVRNSSWMLAGQGSSILIQSLYFVVLARLLGAADYGVLAGAVSLIAVASTYSSLGSGFIFLRYVSSDHSRFQAYWGYLIGATVLGGLGVVALIAVIANWIFPHLSVLAVVCLTLGDCLFLQITNGAGKVFQTFERMQYSALSSLIVNALRLGLAFWLLTIWHHSTVTQWAIASVSISCLGAVLAFSVVSAKFGLPKLSLKMLRTHSFEGLLFSTTISTSSVYNDADKILLVHYGMNAANGIYAMAYKAIDTTFMVVRSIHSAAFPRFCREGANGISATQSFARRLLSNTLLISLATSALLFLTAPLIPVFAGREFADSVFALRFLCLIPCLRCCHLAAGDALSGSGYQKYRFSYELGAAVFNFAINLYLIPRYSWKGAAASSLATDGALALVSWTAVNTLAARARRRSIAEALA